MSQSNSRRLNVQVDNGIDAVLFLHGGTNTWGLSILDGIEGSFEWQILDEAKDWLNSAKTQPVEFKTFQSSPYQDDSDTGILILGKIGQLGYLGFYSEELFWGASMDTKTLDLIINVLSELAEVSRTKQ